MCVIILVWLLFCITLRNKQFSKVLMKNTFISLLILITPFIHTYGQRLSIDIMPGLMNYSGDLQPSPLTFKEAGLAMEAGLQYKLTDNLYVRGDYLAGTVQADDKKNPLKYRGRNLNFKSVILEGSFSLEYDFFKFRVDRQWTPYIFAGVAYFYFNPYTHDTAGTKYYLEPYGTEGQGLAQYPNRKFYNIYQFNIPAGFGLKYAINDKWSVGFEVGFRKLFTDYLDDVSTTFPDPNLLMAARGPTAVELSSRTGELTTSVVPFPTGAKRGNPSSKDYYYTGLLRLTYTFINYNAVQAASYKRLVGCPRL